MSKKGSGGNRKRMKMIRIHSFPGTAVLMLVKNTECSILDDPSLLQKVKN
jgi:hypothetical protein